MMIKQRRKGWADGSDAANDYTVIDERGEKIGRIYRTLVGRGRGYAWNWMVYRGPDGMVIRRPRRTETGRRGLGAMGRPKAAVTGKASSFWAKRSMAGSGRRKPVGHRERFCETPRPRLRANY
jgi:hypothetical protein